MRLCEQHDRQRVKRGYKWLLATLYHRGKHEFNTSLTLAEMQKSIRHKVNGYT